MIHMTPAKDTPNGLKLMEEIRSRYRRKLAGVTHGVDQKTGKPWVLVNTGSNEVLSYISDIPKEDLGFHIRQAKTVAKRHNRGV